MNAQRIVNLPVGGGSNSGRDIWFAIETEDGARQELQLHLHQLETFMLSLRRFGSSAEDLLEKHYPGARVALEKYSPTAVDFVARKAEDGAISLSLLDDLGTPMRVNLPPTSIKPLLVALLAAIAERN